MKKYVKIIYEDYIEKNQKIKKELKVALVPFCDKNTIYNNNYNYEENFEQFNHDLFSCGYVYLNDFTVINFLNIKVVLMYDPSKKIKKNERTKNMKIYKITQSQSNHIEAKMKDFYTKRTNQHIKRVQKYCNKIEKLNEKFKGLSERGKKHDKSKFETKEKEPYIYMTWNYKCKREDKKYSLPKGMQEKIDKAVQHHYSVNRHHPEYHDKNSKSIVNGSNMTNLDIGEMVADWLAMSEELGDSTKEWADKNIGKKWKFTKKQKDLIYYIIENIS